jgi:hypothetical protein
MGMLFRHFTSPENVRQQVIEKLSERFAGAAITVESAELQLLGAIHVKDVRISLRDDPKQDEVIYIPSAVIYHDKELLGYGKLGIRKIELSEPRVRAVRNPQGDWNLARLRWVPHPEEPVPTIVIHQGWVTIEDRLQAASLPAMQLTDVSLTLLEDPRDTLNFAGTAKSELATGLEIKGLRQNGTAELELSINVSGLTVGPTLVKRFAAYWPELHSHAQHLRGNATVQADFAYHPALVQPWTHRVHLDLSGGKFTHPKIPMPLDDLEVSARCLDGQITMEKLTARSGSALIAAHLSTPSLTAETDLTGVVNIVHLPLSHSLFQHLPANLQKIEHDYAPTGLVGLTVQFCRRAGRWSQNSKLHPEDMAISFVRFPYPVEHITGALDQEIDPDRHVDRLHVDLSGYAGKQMVYIKGDVTGEGPDAAVDIKIWADNVPLDQRIRAALSPQHQKIANSFHPSGLGNIEAYIRRQAGSHEFSNRYLIHFHHATACYDEFPYPLENVSGVLHIEEDHFEFSGFRGDHKGGAIQTRGRSYAAPQGDRLDIQVSGENILIDSELEAALKPELREAWRIFRPAGNGRMRFRAQVDRLPDKPPDVDVTVTAAGCAICPEFFPYSLHELTGTLRYARHWVHVKNLRAAHGASVMTLEDGKIYLKPGGGIWADLTNVRGSPLIPDSDLLTALPPVLRQSCETLQLHDPVAFQTRLTIETAGPGTLPVVFWDGKLAFTDASLLAGVPIRHIRGEAACRGRCDGQQLQGLVGNIAFSQATIFNQPFRDLQTEIEVRKETPNILAFNGIHARFFGGEVYGPVRIEFGPPLRYEMNLTAAQVRLEEMGRHNLGNEGAQWSGLAGARLHLTGQGQQVADLEGQGTIDVPNGRLYNLPLFLDLLKFLGLRLPDGTAFEEAHVVFAIHGLRVAVSRLDLFGNAISLRGQGEMNLDGTDINLDFYAVWARILQYLPPIIKDIPPLVSQQLLKIKMRGRINDVHFTKEPVPVIVEPLRELLERLSGRGGNR